MTAKEKKLVALGAGAGIIVTALAVGLLVGRERTYAAEATPPPPARATQPAVAAPLDADPGTQPGATLKLTPAEITAAGVQVAEVRIAALKTNIDSFGRVEQPEAQLAAVSARVGGRVDKLYVQYTGESVRRGQAVADVYSPEVATAIEDYRLAQENRNQLRQSDDPNARVQADALVTASQRKLELWGITGNQINAPETGGTPHVTLYASASGSVVDRKVTQGQYVNAGDTLFTVADLSQVWIKADVYEDQLPQVRRGQEVEITSEALPNRTLHGHVDFIEPQANPQTRTVPVHVHVANPGMRLLPGMFVSATFVSTAPSQSIVVPRSAVLDTGTRKIVYLARPNGVFEAREVALGTPSDDLFPVTSGLALGDKVVLSGNFLIDSQAHLSSGMSGMYGGSKEFAANAAAPASAAGGGAADANAAKLDFHADSDPLKAGEDNVFRVALTGADGKPIPDAHVTVALIMPAMPSMSMPEMKNSFELPWSAGQHLYMGKGQPPMSGSWNVTVEARKSGAVIATFHTHLNAK
ncbi:MAG: efflux RND transporter periplasmic adaptor subunit [Acidobacteriaceae bacterium]|jgi:Cu(I)/Ag(I) efflux system membrane fusion protein/cobalt-zinc-cadmium efflux system membrane fusion protein